MAILTILHFPHPGLKEKASPITKITDEIKQLAENMLETMYEAHGVGLAATQVNVPKRLLVLDVSSGQNSPEILINPEIITQSGLKAHDEGCLSFPGIYVSVKRAETISVKFLDLAGKEQTLENLTDLKAICIQHEIDHLDGITFYDKLSWIKKNRLMKELEKNRNKTF